MTFLRDQFFKEIGGCSRRTIETIRKQSLRRLILSTGRSFQKLPTVVSNGQVFYDDGKLQLGHRGTNALDCYAVRDGGRGCDNLSKSLCRLYSIPLKPTIKDQVNAKKTSIL